ncbi:MAG: hypothetical protein JNL28_14090 [Planctomycetes bacterium]|nr:hypothetical protein [Planctomycetota bacterium]
MTPRTPSRLPGELSLNRRALDDLGFIRRTMESAGAHTAIPGWGGVLMGATACAAAPFAIAAESGAAWFGVWMVAAAVGASIGGLEMWRKARDEGVSLVAGPGSRFAKALAPGLIAGLLLTLALRAVGPLDLLPGMWLLCYGTAVIGAGAHSICAVRSMGLAIMLVGSVALLGTVFLRDSRLFGDLCMVAGFGVMHVVFGFRVARERRG